MMKDSEKINTLIMDVRTEIPAIARAIDADPYLPANVEARDGNRVAIIVRPKLFKQLPPGVRIQDKIDELYSLIEQAVLEKARDYKVDVLVVRED